MYEQERTAAVGHTLAREEPDHRVHVGAGYAGRRAARRRQVLAEGHPSAVAWYSGPKGELDPPLLCTFLLNQLCLLVSPPSSLKLQNKNDPNLANVPGDHPFINVAALEAEGVALLQRLITDLYTKQYVESVIRCDFDELHGSYTAFTEIRTSYPLS